MPYQSKQNESLARLRENDLCAQTVKTSQASIKRLAEIALREIQESGLYNPDPHRTRQRTAAERLAAAASDIALAARMLAGFESLVDGTRTELVVTASFNPS